MSRLQQLQKSLLAYKELDRLSDIAMQLTTENAAIGENIPALIEKQLILIQQIDSELQKESTLLENDADSSALLRERHRLMERMLQKSRDNAVKLTARKSIIGNELTNIRKGRGSISAYKEPVQTSGKLIQNRY